jgi:hypothetical protein
MVGRINAASISREDFVRFEPTVFEGNVVLFDISLRRNWILETFPFYIPPSVRPVPKSRSPNSCRAPGFLPALGPSRVRRNRPVWDS